MEEPTNIMQAQGNEPQPTAPNAEPPAEDVGALRAEIEKLQKASAAREKQLKEAEYTLDATRKEYSDFKRGHSTTDEQLEEQRKEMEQKARQYDIQRNSLSAEKILVGANLAEDDYRDALGLIVSEDSEKTEAIAKWVVDVLGKQTKIAEKAGREKGVRDTPHPPAGGIDEADPFVAAFKKG